MVNACKFAHVFVLTPIILYHVLEFSWKINKFIIFKVILSHDTSVNISMCWEKLMS